MIYQCCNDNRKSLVLEDGTLNGIDFLEVLDQDVTLWQPPVRESPRQQTLLLNCLKPVAGLNVQPNNVRIEGGESITKIKVERVKPAAEWVTPQHPPTDEQRYFAALPNPEKVLVIRTDRAGDFSPYTLRLVSGAAASAGAASEVVGVLDNVDPLLAKIPFSFKVECPRDFDCAPAAPNCPPELATPPPINYLAKDFGSFKTIMLDRLNQLLPDWGSVSEADLGMVLAELIAYVGDHLSYQQDAVATEAYLQTARSRVSLRRHAVLVGYTVHDGCNARAWIHLTMAPGNPVTLDSQTRFYTTAPGMPADLRVGAGNEDAAIVSGVEVFEAVQVSGKDLAFGTLCQEHNEIHFHTWGDSNCCLPKGATEATLKGSLPNLSVGDVLIFQEVLGPQTGAVADADIRHRCAVRLTYVSEPGLTDPLTTDCCGRPVPIREIRWSSDDALAFPLCISSTLPGGANSQPLENVSIALGNIVLADHGLSIPAKSLGSVLASWITLPPDPSADRCSRPAATPLPARYRPRLPESPVTQVVPVDSTSSAKQLMEFDPRKAIPVIQLKGTLNNVAQSWECKQDLLESQPEDPHFVMEVEWDGTATLRFGDNTNGKAPEPHTTFTATYRIGNGTDGNVGVDTLVNLATRTAGILACSNPLPADGGTEPETNAQIRRRAPEGFLIQDRAITMADYEALVEQNPQVENAVASLRWNGSWYTVFIAVQPKGGGDLTPALQQALEAKLQKLQLAGQDLQLDSPQYLSLEIELEVTVDPGYFQSYVRDTLAQVLGNGILPDGRQGLFYADNFTFGQTVYLSPVYAAARSVAGVLAVTARKFQPQGVDTDEYLKAGELKLGSLQIARLENNPSLPDHGRLKLVMLGGK
jgi:hypothetical protein